MDLDDLRRDATTKIYGICIMDLDDLRSDATHKIYGICF